MVRRRLDAGEAAPERIWHDLQADMPSRAIHWNYISRLVREWKCEKGQP